MSEFESLTDGENTGSHTQIFTSRHFKFAVAHEEMNSRRRNTMEDVHRILPQLDPSHPVLSEYSYIGIYDGHGGRQIVDFLETALEKNVGVELKQEGEGTIEERITSAFLLTDLESKVLKLDTSGATAVVALLFPDPKEGDKLVVANVGDSRAVLVSKKQSTKPANDIEEEDENSGPKYGYFAHRLSYDHRADDPSEQRRIAAAGGFVSRNRVLGILAVSRSFGDHGMKDFVTAQPYISSTLLAEHEDDNKVLILACDGVWDVLTDQEAADLIIARMLEKGGPDAEAAEFLVNTAIERGSADNVTAIVAYL